MCLQFDLDSTAGGNRHAVSLIEVGPKTMAATKLEGHGEAVYRIPVVPVEHGLWTLDVWSVSASGEN